MYNTKKEYKEYKVDNLTIIRLNANLWMVYDKHGMIFLFFVSMIWVLDSGCNFEIVHCFATVPVMKFKTTHMPDPSIKVPLPPHVKSNY